MNQIDQIKNSIIALQGKEVHIEKKKYRGKQEKYKGIINATYPAFFTINIKDETLGHLNNKTKSFNYTDILTKDIEINELAKI